MQKVIFVPAYGKPIYGEKKVKVRTGETKKGLFGGEKEITKTETRIYQTGESDCKIDGDRLARDVNEQIQLLTEDGYKISGMQDVTSGSYAYQFKEMRISSSQRIIGSTEAVSGNGGFGYGYGFGYTSGVLLLAEKQ